MSLPRMAENLTELTVAIISASRGSLESLSTDLVRSWHVAMLAGIDVPADAYRGGFRGDAHPALLDYESNVGGLPTVPAAEVPMSVAVLIGELQDRLDALDMIDQDQGDDLSAAFVEQVLDTGAWLHGEWVRIHPFVNGNGRTARMLALWLCARYGIPQLLPLRPRPDMGYDPACFLSMTGDHTLLRQYLYMRYNQA